MTCSGWDGRSPTRRSLLYQRGDSYTGLHIVAKGLIKSYRRSTTGRQLVLRFHGLGEVCDETPLFLEALHRVHGATAEVIERVSALYLPAAPLLAYLDGRPRLYRVELSGLAARLAQTVDHLEMVVLNEVPVHIARFLCERTQRSPFGSISVSLGIPKATLAAHPGAVPETLSRCFRSLVQEAFWRKRTAW